ncbi:MAG: hypothetical protein ACI9WC_001781 [Arenicella sp.]|jgi:hypothetical protein
MSKNIIICSDGTGNTGGKGSVTNVWRMFESINRASNETVQVAFYDDGVGTESFKPMRILGGAFGVGLARNVKQLYTEICRIYEPGDKLFFFGFSRGAFTVRTLLGWIMEVGLINPVGTSDARELDALVNKSYKSLRAHFRTIPERLFISEKTAEKRKDKLKDKLFELNSEQERSLGHFIGVWDTVDAVGFPVAFLATFWNSWIHQFKFPDHRLNEKVRNAFHALAIDDERLTFHPQPWDEKDKRDDQNLQQVWFAGMHSNVGGGYPQDGMAYVPLVWIMDGAIVAGIKLTDSLATLYRERANPMEKMYNSRSGAGLYYRFSPRNLTRIAHQYNLKQVVIHPSVASRAHQSPSGYTPRHLPVEHKIWSVGTVKSSHENALTKALTEYFSKTKESDISEIGGLWDKIRKGLQWYVVSFTLVFAGSALAYGLIPNKFPVSYLADIIFGAAPDFDWAIVTLKSGVLLALTFVLALIAERNSHHKRSRFWTAISRSEKRLTRDMNKAKEVSQKSIE